MLGTSSMRESLASAEQSAASTAALNASTGALRVARSYPSPGRRPVAMNTHGAGSDAAMFRSARPISRFSAPDAVGRASCDNWPGNAATETSTHAPLFRPRSQEAGSRVSRYTTCCLGLRPTYKMLWFKPPVTQPPRAEQSQRRRLAAGCRLVACRWLALARHRWPTASRC